MNTPFASSPLAPLGAPKRPLSSPLSGRRSLPRRRENACVCKVFSGTASTRRRSPASTRPSPSIRRDRRASSARRTPISRRWRRISMAERSSTRRLDAKRAALCLQGGERAICLRNSAFRVAQRVARLTPLAFLRVELAAQALDAPAQLGEIALARRRLGGDGRAGDEDDECAAQTLALPWAETAARRRSSSAASPK